MTNKNSDTKILATKPLFENLLSQADILTKELAVKKITPKLVIIAVGENPASEVYMKNKIKTSARCGITTEIHRLEANISQEELNSQIKSLSDTTDNNGIILQLPLPKHLDRFLALSYLTPLKDADGLTSTNAGKYVMAEADTLYPATPLGIMRIIEWAKFSLTGKNVVVIGRSHLVGLPTANLISLRDATVTSCHKETQNISEFTKNADLIVSAAGCLDLVKGKQLKKGVFIIDVGINQANPDDENCNKITGDTCKDCLGVAGMITPVPGGVGPMTVISLMTNTIDATFMQNNLPRPNWEV